MIVNEKQRGDRNNKELKCKHIILGRVITYEVF